MTTATTRRPVASRRSGYLAGALVNVALLVLINAWPGWQAVPFLTEELSRILVLVNIIAITGVVTNVVYLVHDPPRLVTLGGVLTTGLGLVGLVRFWQVFPFDFGAPPAGWAVLARIVLVVGVVGTCIGLVVQLASLARRDQRPRSTP